MLYQEISGNTDNIRVRTAIISFPPFFLVRFIFADVRIRTAMLHEHTSGLPDLSWQNIPKQEKYTKWP
jgi:hypothetical protein